MTFDEWVKEYEPIKNPLNPDANFDGFMFETFGDEVGYLKGLGSLNTFYWTLIAEGDEMSIVPGVRWINRIGYFATKKEWKTTDSYVEL